MRLSEKKTRLLYFGLLSVCIAILGFSPLGLITTENISITTLHIPVIVGAILTGYVYGAALGAVFGLVVIARSLIFPPSSLDLLFADPLVAVAPRLLIGIVSAFVYKGLMRMFDDQSAASKVISSGTAAIGGSIVNTIGVLVALALRHPEQMGISGSTHAVSLIFSRIVGLNGIVEVALAVACAVPLVLLLTKSTTAPVRKGLRSTVHKWLFTFVALTFLLTIGISYAMQTRQSDRIVAILLKMEINYIKEQINANAETLRKLEEDAAKTLIDKAQALALIVQANPLVLQDYAALKNISAKLELDELCISDEKGLAIASVPDKYVGRHNYKDHAATLPYMGLIRDKNLLIVEKPRPSATEREGAVVYQQYAGVPRLDRPGIIQVVLNAEHYGRAAAAASIANLATDYNIGRTGYAVLCHGDKIASAPERGWTGRSALDYGLPEEVLTHDAGVFRLQVKGERVAGAYARHGAYTIVTIVPEAEMYENRNNLLAWNSVMYFILFAVVFVVISRLLYEIVIKGIVQTNQSLGLITAGNLNEKVEVRTSGEFISLSDGINTTVSALKDAIAAEAAKIDAELELARRIQISSLQNVFPPYPNRREFDIYAAMHTAKEVGGDFYDFFFIDDNNLVFVAADVSGKGIPAALFMMTAKTHIKNHMFLRAPLGESLAEVNNHLCEGNEAGMFVTAFIGVLDVGSGLLTYANAGHPPPLLRRAGGDFEWLRTVSGPIMGALEGLPYTEATLQLHGGDRVFCYTDGVTEATDKDERLFGEERLIKTLGAHKDESLVELLATVKTAIDAFVQDAPQFDDITLLGIDYHG